MWKRKYDKLENQVKQNQLKIQEYAQKQLELEDEIQDIKPQLEELKNKISSPILLHLLVYFPEDIVELIDDFESRKLCFKCLQLYPKLIFNCLLCTPKWEQYCSILMKGKWPEIQHNRTEEWDYIHQYFPNYPLEIDAIMDKPAAVYVQVGHVRNFLRISYSTF